MSLLGQRKELLFVALDQLPGAELFYRGTMAFCRVIVQLSLTQRELKQTLGKLSVHIHIDSRERVEMWGEGS